MSFFVYMLRTNDTKKTKTYVGYTNSLLNRLREHNSNKGAKSTKGRKWIIIFKKTLFQTFDKSSEDPLQLIIEKMRTKFIKHILCTVIRYMNQISKNHKIRITFVKMGFIGASALIETLIDERSSRSDIIIKSLQNLISNNHYIYY